MPDEALIYVVAALSLASLIVGLVLLARGRGGDRDPALATKLELLENGLTRCERVLREELGQSREESAGVGRALRTEILDAFGRLAESLRSSANDLARGQKTQLDGFAEQLGTMKQETAQQATNLREEIQNSLTRLSAAIKTAVDDLSGKQTEKLDEVIRQITQLTEGTVRRHESFSTAVDSKLDVFRTDTTANAKALREEVQATLGRLGEGIVKSIGQLVKTQGEKLDGVTQQIATLTDGNERRQETLRLSVEERLKEIRTDATANAKALREDIQAALKQASDALAQNLNQIANVQRERLDQVSQSVTQMTAKSSEQGDELRRAVEGRLDTIRTENAEKLERMRQTVDEKLEGTLEKRLGASFKLVSEQLEQVHRSVGEMQNLANGVGDLKRVLTNVKARGTWGEVSLEGLLEQILSADQFAKNVEVKSGSNQRVEFAIRLPGPDGQGQVWLPIDAKFPQADYENLLLATDKNDLEGIEAAQKAIELRIKQSAKEICDKYINPPDSTDFAVLFLPTEGLFAEVIRRPGLVDSLQRDCRIVVAGPTTLTALLNSLRMGFRSLAIQKRSSEVWQVLAAVKTEFSKYGEIMGKVQRKLNEASATIENVSVRHRAINRKLRTVEELPEAEASAVLGLTVAEELVAEDA